MFRQWKEDEKLWKFNIEKVCNKLKIPRDEQQLGRVCDFVFRKLAQANEITLMTGSNVIPNFETSEERSFFEKLIFINALILFPSELNWLLLLWKAQDSSQIYERGDGVRNLVASPDVLFNFHTIQLKAVENSTNT